MLAKAKGWVRNDRCSNCDWDDDFDINDYENASRYEEDKKREEIQKQNTAEHVKSLQEKLWPNRKAQEEEISFEKMLDILSSQEKAVHRVEVIKQLSGGAASLDREVM